MDKLIEAEAKCAHKRVVHRPMPIEGGLWADRWYCDLCKSEFTPLAAVRAHDAGTDEEVISYRARQIWRRFVGIPITEPYTAEFQWLLDLLSGNEAPKKTLTEAVQAARGNLEPPTVPIRFDSPASHAAESAPLLPSDTLHICTACWAGNHGSCSGGKCGCVHESASVAQLDAEDQHRAAEPMAERYVAGAAYRELMAAAQAHVTALEACEPAISNAFGFSVIHGGNYTGPYYGKELTALKAALAALPAQDAELEKEK